MLLELGSAYDEAQAQLMREQTQCKWLPENHVVYPHAEFICPACKEPVKSKLTFLVDKRNKIVWRAFADGRELKFNLGRPSEHVHPHVYTHRSVCMGYDQDGRSNQDIAAALFTGLNPESQICDVGIWMRDVVGHKCFWFESVYQAHTEELRAALEPRRLAEWPGIYARALRTMTEEELAERGFADIPENADSSWLLNYSAFKVGDWVQVDLEGSNYVEYLSGLPSPQNIQPGILIASPSVYPYENVSAQQLFCYLPLLGITAYLTLNKFIPFIRTAEPLPDLYPWGVGDVVKLTDAAIANESYKRWWRWNDVPPTVEFCVLSVSRPGGTTQIMLLDEELRAIQMRLSVNISGQQLQLVRRG